MGVKSKKAMKKQIEAGSLQLSTPKDVKQVDDYLPLEGGPAREIPEQPLPESTGTILYIGRIPHGFNENEMEGYFKQFGPIKRLRIARNKKTGKSKHFGFIQYEDAEVAKIVADTMNNYLLFEHVLQVTVIPPERVHPKLWKGINRHYKPPNWVQIQRKRQDKVRTLEEHNKLIARIMKRDQKRRKRIEAAGIDYECPDIVGNSLPASKKIRFED